jgi:hypothetical protein
LTPGGLPGGVEPVLDVLVFGLGVVAAPAVRLVLVRLRCGRWSELPAPAAHLPPPAGHQVVVAPGDCTLKCCCGWWYTVPWPPTSRRLNGARLGHYGAVEQQRIAQRLGIDTDSVLDQVVAVRQAARHPPQQELARSGPTAGRPRTSRRALEARRATAIARVEAARVLPQYTGSDQEDRARR